MTAYIRGMVKDETLSGKNSRTADQTLRRKADLDRPGLDLKDAEVTMTPNHRFESDAFRLALCAYTRVPNRNITHSLRG